MTLASHVRACLRPAALASALLFCLACFESDPIVELKASPDGRYVATANAAGELGILDLEEPGSLPIYSSYLGQGFGWSPDSRALAFIEVPPGQPPELRVADPESQAPPRLLRGGFDWKGDPGWLDARRIVYRSGADSDHINVHVADADSGQSKLLADVGRDIAGLWPLPDGGGYLYAILSGDASELWHGGASGEPPTQLVRTDPDTDLMLNLVSISPDGRAVAFVARGPGTLKGFIYDLKRRRISASSKLGAPPESLALLSRDRALLGDGARVQVWRPGAWLRAELSEGRQWNGLPVSLASPRGGAGIAAALNGNIILTARGIGSLGAGTAHARGADDLLDLALRLQLAGQAAQADSWLRDMAESRQSDPAQALRLEANAAWVARQRGEFRTAGDALARIVERVDRDAPLWRTAWLERLCLALFEEGSPERAETAFAALPEELRDSPEAEWIHRLAADGDPKLVDQWAKAGRLLRKGALKDCAQAIADLSDSGPLSPLSRRGMAHLLRMELDPLGGMLLPDTLSYADLTSQPDFQRAFLRLASREPAHENGMRDLRGMLLLQWAKSRQTEAATALAQMDLTDEHGSTMDYFDILSRHLEAEEQEEWLEQAVGEILFSERILPLLGRRMEVDLRSHLLFALSRAKLAIVQGDMRALDAILSPLERELADVPNEFWNPQTGRLLHFSRLFRAKHDERERRWDKTLQGYEACLKSVEMFPSDWGITPFDLAWMRDLIQAGAANPELLRSFLQTLRGLGDPLINPAYEPPTLVVGLANYATLRQFNPDPWAKPFIAFAEGHCYALLDRPYRAIERFRKAREANPPEGLKARILLEEAAARSSQGQYRLAADLLAQLCQMSLPPPQTVKAIEALAQAERRNGQILSQEDRMRYLLKERRVPWRWAATLIDSDSILPPDGEAGAVRQ